jgi:inhibitor of KinA sporulation pathway (predicted exonuclease)
MEQQNISIFVDFEMQPVDHKEHPGEWEIARHEIIEIGAVMLDGDLKEMDSFQCYVKPLYSTEIQETVEAMTGISSATLVGAPDFAEAFARFVEWSSSPGLSYTIYAWSGADKGQIVHEILLKKITKTDAIGYMLSHWYDYQKIFTRAIGRRLAVSLDKAVTACGLTFEGQMHDALWDARNTARLFRLTSDKKNFRKIAPRVKHTLESKEHFTASLGDMVDMSKFNLPKE